MRCAILPSLLVANERVFLARLRTIEGVASMVHIDVADGRFVPTRSWANPQTITHLHTPTTFDVHLMAHEPVRRVAVWGAVRHVRRITVHAEATSNLPCLLAHVRKTGRAVGVAMNPKTPLHVLTDVAQLFDAILIMANDPGYSGRPFRRATLKRIEAIRRMFPRIPIGVDIGITPTTAPLARRAGATEAIAGSAIFNTNDPVAAFHLLQNAFRTNTM